MPVSACLTQAAWESGWNLNNSQPFGEGCPNNCVKYKAFVDAADGYGRLLRFFGMKEADYVPQKNPYERAWAFANDPGKFLVAIGDTYCCPGYAKALENGIRQPLALYLYD